MNTFKDIKGPCIGAMEASRSWGKMYDVFEEELEGVDALGSVTVLTDFSGAFRQDIKMNPLEGWFKESTKNTRIPGLSAGRNTLQKFFIEGVK